MADGCAAIEVAGDGNWKEERQLYILICIYIGAKHVFSGHTNRSTQVVNSQCEGHTWLTQRQGDCEGARDRTHDQRPIGANIFSPINQLSYTPLTYVKQICIKISSSLTKIWIRWLKIGNKITIWLRRFSKAHENVMKFYIFEV